MTGPLSNVRVLDLSRVLAGPWCTQILADMGADVVKVERPGVGDDTRQWGPPWLEAGDGSETAESAYFLAANRNKRSIALDLGSAAGQQVARDLAAECDVVVENFKTGSLKRKGLDYDSLSAADSSLVYLSITGFGQTGPMADQPGYDYLAQALGGFMSITGVPDGQPGAGPQKAGVAIADLFTGMYATVSVLGALVHRAATGVGQHIDLALLDSQVAVLANQGLNYLVSGVAPPRTGGWHTNLAPYQPFDASDAPFILAVGNDTQFGRLCNVLGTEALVTDERFATNPARNKHRVELAGLLQEQFRRRPRAEWLQALPAAGVPAASVNSIADVFDEPQVVHRGMRVDLPHSEGGTAPGIANPINYSATPVDYRTAPPLLGEHTDEVLRDVLGRGDAQIEALRADGVIA